MIVGPRGVLHTTRKPTDTLTHNHMDSQRLNLQPGNLHRTDLGPEHRNGLLLRLLTARAETVSDLFAYFWDTISYTGLPCPILICGDVPSLTATGYGMFSGYLWECCLFMNRKGV